ncbi:hypothetical protein AX23_10800 [Brucella melitensis 548]|nr:hypothetical protein AX23_10800 [Brucella melitensis 548]
MRHVTVDRVIVVNVFATLFESDHSREAVSAGEGVGDLAGAVGASSDDIIVDDITEVTGEGMEFGFVDTNLETTKRDICKLQIGAGAYAAISDITIIAEIAVLAIMT